MGARRRRSPAVGLLVWLLAEGLAQPVVGQRQGDLNLGMGLDDSAEARGAGLAVPRAGYAQAMHCRGRRGVAADQYGGHLARFAQKIVLDLGSGRYGEPPVGMQPVLRIASLGIG